MLSGLLQPRFQGKSTKWVLCAPVVLVLLILLSVRNAANTSRYQSHQISLENKYNYSSNGINNSDPTIITANHDEETNVSMMFHVYCTTEETVIQFHFLTIFLLVLAM